MPGAENARAREPGLGGLEVIGRARARRLPKGIAADHAVHQALPSQLGVLSELSHSGHRYLDYLIVLHHVYGA